MTHRFSRALTILALSASTFASAFASACPSNLPSALSLTLVPGEIRGVENMLLVSVQNDGCANRDASEASSPCRHCAGHK
jgi:hypothetical protein